MAKSVQSFNVADDSDVATERAKLIDIQSRLNTAKRQVESQATLNGGAERSAFDIDVDRELGREDTAAARVVPSQEEAMQRYRVLAAAYEKQRRIVAEAVSRASVKIVAAALPQYKAIISREASHMSALRQALIEERDFREALTAGDVSFAGTIRPMPLAGHINAGETDLFDAWLSEARQFYAV